MLLCCAFKKTTTRIKRVDPMLRAHKILNIRHIKTKGHKESFVSNGYVDYLGYGDGIKVTQTHQNAYIIHVQFFAYQLYLNKAFKSIRNETKDITPDPERQYRLLRDNNKQ